MKKLIFTLLLSVISANAFAYETDIELITKTPTSYIDDSSNMQSNRLKTAFYENLNLYYVKNDSIKIWSGKAYIKNTKEGEPTGEIGKIISIDYKNNETVANVETSHPKNKKSYVDYFLLLKTESKWTFINKIYTKRK